MKAAKTSAVPAQAGVQTARRELTDADIHESLKALDDAENLLFQSVVMVVDDNEFDRKLVEKMLEETLYELTFADSGAHALSLLCHKRHDLILMDIDMPNLNGLETLRLIKANPKFASIPVMMVTGHSGKDVVVDCLKAGAVGFVVKPLDRDIFLKKVAKFLGQ